MRSPSAKVCTNRCDIYVAANPTTADIAGGMVFAYPSAPTARQVPCTIQATMIREVVDEQDRITQVLEYKVMFAGFQNVSPRDKLLYQDPAGTTHTLFVEVQRDEAGRGAAFTVRATEKI
jgi:hypothetical protein